MTQTKTEKQWTILSLLNWSEQYLKEKGIDSPRLNGELLLAYVLRCERVYLYTHFDKPLLKDELDKFKNLFLRRVKREPLQYIIRKSDFYGRQFYVDQRVLIPRPETEHLVEAVLEIEKGKNSERTSLSIADIGTGSGVLAVTLSLELPYANITATDVRAEALEIARRNAERHGVADRISFVQNDVLTMLPESDGLFSYVVSNPPYVSGKAFAELAPELREYEPRVALTDEADGLTFFKRFAKIAPSLLVENGWCIVEVGFGQSDYVESLFREQGAENIRTWNDLAGIPRIVGGSW